MSRAHMEFPVIVVLEGDFVNQNWPLNQPAMVLGRDETCDIMIPERQISRQHVRFIRKDGDTYLIEDLGSKNGTWVNGLLLEGTRRLSDGDEINIARALRLRFIGSGITVPVTGDLPQVIQSSSFGGRLQIDPESRQVFVNGAELDPPLSLPQYRLLELLYTNAGRICTRNSVIEAVWPDEVADGISEQAIDALVRRLRDRIAEVDPEWQYVVTVRGHGFRLDNPEE